MKVEERDAVAIGRMTEEVLRGPPNFDAAGLIGRSTDVVLDLVRTLAVMASSRTLQSPILVGRDAALMAFERALAEAGRGRGGAILVAGEAGIGKSRVLGALRRQATASGFRAAVGRLEPQDQLVPLAANKDFGRSTAAGPALLGDLHRV